MREMLETFVASLEDDLKGGRHGLHGEPGWNPVDDDYFLALEYVAKRLREILDLDHVERLKTAETYTIKPLEWEHVGSVEDDPQENWIASSVIGPFCVWQALTGMFVWHYGTDFHECDSIEAGKLWAEQHYQECLKTALEPCQTAQVDA